jgi:hypothetical protein
MSAMGLSLCVQLMLMAGVAGLLWPEKFIPVFEILMFPWAATHRSVRMNSLGAIGLSALLFLSLVLRMH